MDDKPGVAAAERLPETMDTSVVQPADETKGECKQQPPIDSLDNGATVTLTPLVRQTSDRSKKIRTTGEPEVQTPSQYEVLGKLGRGGMGIVYVA